MKATYQDIKDRIGIDPLWYDENGTPRYCNFHPMHCADVYAQAAALLLIECQHCNSQFHVAMSGVHWSWDKWPAPKELHYGDPPAHRCTGDTMNCEDIAVLESWHRGEYVEWHRCREEEGLIDG